MWSEGDEGWWSEYVRNGRCHKYRVHRSARLPSPNTHTLDAPSSPERTPPQLIFALLDPRSLLVMLETNLPQRVCTPPWDSLACLQDPTHAYAAVAGGSHSAYPHMKYSIAALFLSATSICIWLFRSSIFPAQVMLIAEIATGGLFGTPGTVMRVVVRYVRCGTNHPSMLYGDPAFSYWLFQGVAAITWKGIHRLLSIRRKIFVWCGSRVSWRTFRFAAQFNKVLRYDSTSHLSGSLISKPSKSNAGLHLSYNLPCLHVSARLGIHQRIAPPRHTKDLPPSLQVHKSAATPDSCVYSTHR